MQIVDLQSKNKKICKKISQKVRKRSFAKKFVRKRSPFLQTVSFSTKNLGSRKKLNKKIFSSENNNLRKHVSTTLRCIRRFATQVLLKVSESKFVLCTHL